MQTNFFFLSPVEVVKVNSSNLEEVAEWCGGKVAETESRRVPGRMDKYVWVPTPKGSRISWAFPGMFITKRLVITLKGELRATWAVFNRDYFDKNYFESPEIAVNETWEKEDRSKVKKPVAPKPTEPKKKDPEYLSAQERDIKIHVGQAAQPGEPVNEPTPTTEEIETMDAESRERIEQVNREIMAGKVKKPEFITPSEEDAKKAVEGFVNPGAVIEEIKVEPTGQASITVSEAVAMHNAEELVKSELGGVVLEGEDFDGDTEVVIEESVAGEEKPLNTDTEPAVFEHVHNYEDKCGEHECGNDRYTDGIHIFADVIIEASPEGWRVQGTDNPWTKP